MIWKAVYVLPVPVAMTSSTRFLPGSDGFDRTVDGVELVVARVLLGA